MNAKRILLRLVTYALSFLAITFLMYMLMYLAPGDAATKMLAQMGAIADDELGDAIRANLGLDQSFIVQYFKWLGNALTGNLGNSFRSGQPVGELLGPALWRTVGLAARAFVPMVAVSLVCGLLCARYKGRPVDKIVRFATYVLWALPMFVVGILFLYVFGFALGWFPISATAKEGEWSLVLPVTVLTLSMSSWLIRQIRTVVLERRSEPYVIGLRACGISETRIDVFYVMRHSLVPIITDFGICLGSMMGGAVLVETIFSWPGVGMVLITAINNLDYPTIQAFALWIAFIYFAINVLIDVFCRMADPRIARGIKTGGQASSDAKRAGAEGAAHV